MKMMCGCDSKKGFKKFEKKTIRANISRLKKQGLIEEGGDKKIYLTALGKQMTLYIKDRYSILEKQWDEKIRIVIFDIPEKKSGIRKWLRGELLLMQFKELQKSVYAGKYPLPEELYQDLIQHEIFEDVHVFTIDQADKMQEIIQFLGEKDGQ